MEPTREATSARDFHLFAQLPPEIRILIWREALPLDATDPPAVFPYRPGCWQPRHLLPSDPEYLHEWGPDHNIDFGFHGYLLESVQTEIPLYFVNKEAREAALAWIRHREIEIWTFQGQTLFSRWFDKDRDVLYVSADASNEFICEPLERPFEPDLIEKTLSVACDSLTRVALPAALIFDNPGIIAEIFPNYGAGVLYLDMGSQPTFSLIPDKMVRRVELVEDVFSSTAVWDATSGTLRLEAGEPLRDVLEDGAMHDPEISEKLAKLVRDHREDLQNQLSSDHVSDFKIQPMYFVR